MDWKYKPSGGVVDLVRKAGCAACRAVASTPQPGRWKGTSRAGGSVINSFILGHDHYNTHIPDGASINEANLLANELGRLPFIHVSTVGALQDELSVWYDGVKKQVRVHIGSFYGSAVDFLEKTKKEYETFKRYRARAHESDASELMMYQDLVPGLAAAVLMIKNEGEREKEKDNGNYNGEA